MTRADIFHFISNQMIIGWFSIAGAAVYCSTSKRTIEMWIKEEGLRISRVRGKRLIRKEWLDDFLKAYEVTNNAKEVDQIVNETLKEMKL
jgi:excisionase family DNA binding protein